MDGWDLANLILSSYWCVTEFGEHLWTQGPCMCQPEFSTVGLSPSVSVLHRLLSRHQEGVVGRHQPGLFYFIYSPRQIS